jgi:hypothetical protein
MKQAKSTYARSGLDYKSTVLMRKEAQAQGVDSVLVWDCSVQCYDKRFISEGGAAVEGQYVWLNVVPFEDREGVPELQKLFEYHEKANKEPDGFGEIAWAAGNLFADAVNSIVDDQGPNAITRANLLEAVRGIHNFTANGLVPETDIGAKKGSVCVIGMRVENGKFVRFTPAEPGQFDCGRNESVEVTLDPLKEFQG